MSFGTPVRNGLGVGLLASTSLSTRNRAGFSPASLFAAGEQGVWYDPSDLSTMFQDSAGTMPVTATGQPVGFLGDKSRGFVLGPELVISPYGGGASGTWAISTTQITRNASATGQASLNLSSTLDTNKRYVVTFSVSGLSGDTVGVRVGSGTAYQVSSNGTYTARLPAGGTGASLIFIPWGGSAGEAAIDNISVRELPGNHATQPTAASRPVLGRVPVGGRRNLLTFTEQFDDVRWTKLNATITANAAVAPDGTMTADLVVSTGGETRVGITGSSPVAATTTYTASIFGKFSNANGRYLWFRDFFSGRDAGFDLQDGVVTQVSANMTASVVVSSGGYFRCVATWTTPAAPVVVNEQFWVQSSSGTAPSSGTVGGQCPIWGAQLETGSTATNYQRVVTALDVTQAGVPDCYYLQTDGTDDFLQTGTITPGTDKVQVFAGVRKLSDAAEGMLLETSTTLSSGSLRMYAPRSASNNYAWRTGGSAQSEALASGYAAPITNVLTGIGDIAADTANLRINGTEVANSAADQGTGNFLAYPLYIGRRAGTTLPFNGQLYSLIVRFGANLSAATVAQAEAFVNSKTGAY